MAASLSKQSKLWQSFDFPTDTMLPGQPLTKDLSLVSCRSQTNQSSGYYKLFFDNDNVLHLLFDGPLISSEYWPDPDLVSWENGRSTYNDSRVAWYDSRGYFNSSDSLDFYAADAGLGPRRRLTLDYDGNLRMYSLQETGGWAVTWQAFSEPCNIHGTSGPNSICSYDPHIGRQCTCIEGFNIKDPRDQAQGCEPEFDLETSGNGVRFLELPHTEAWGYDDVYNPNSTYNHCRLLCLNSKNCKAFLLKSTDHQTTFTCYTKTRLLNLHRSLEFMGTLYVKLRNRTNDTTEAQSRVCKSGAVEHLYRDYQIRKNGTPLNFLLWFAGGLGIVEFTCIFLVWFVFFRSNEDVDAALKGYVLAGTGFNKFSYAELKKATSNFKHEVGKGGSGSVYKGILNDNSVVAIKKLADATQGEAQFLAEMSIIGRLNHMNLIKLWGYCLEGTRRLLVFDFMERGSLAENLYSNSLSWGQRYDITLGTARGLAYLHEECLEWILHCDMKPQNILLDSSYQAKVADFGLSKLLDRDAANNASLSRIRGTRGYMAPEGESKVEAPNLESWLEEIVDPKMEGNYNIDEMKTLALTALQCVEEDKDARPTMKQVVEALQQHNFD
ncbi:hypothetical protein Droror1_Dr00000880 [Drosera rotundifolia]